MDLSSLPPDFWATSGAYTPHIYRDQYSSVDPSNPNLTQEGKVVLITGASKGIGANGFAPAFAKANAKAIILVARNAGGLAETEKAIRAINPNLEVLCYPASIADDIAIPKLYSLIAQKFGHVDVLINNAGVGAQEAVGPLGDVPFAHWWHEYELNVKGTLLMTQSFLQLLGKERSGTIVTMNTLLATTAMPGVSAYGSAKLASMRIVEYVALEYPKVTAVSLQPGVVMTDAIMGA
jgi:NAD(P)-dependent dehydrogenase (short-subunit alcohol dehydrogenase family)